MKFFIDTANLEEIKAAAAMGILDGVTTNPSLAARETKPYRELLAEICRVVPGPVSAEVLATQYDAMVSEAEELAKIADNIVVKIPTILDGVKAIRTLTGQGIATNATLVFSPAQAIMVAKAGATYVSPFVGRLDDIASDGMDLIAKIVTIYQNYGYTTEVLVASSRHPMHLVESALIGADVITMPFDVIKKLINHPLTDIGLEKFLADYKKAQKGPMIPRYTLDEMGALWSDEAKFQAWLQVEIEAARVMARLKIIPAEAFRVIEEKAAFDVARIDEIEKEVNHDVIAFLTSVEEHVGEEAKYMHFGMTSSDVLDTALSLNLKQASAIIDRKITKALQAIKALALKHKMTPCMGRTHGVLAEPTTVGLKFAVWYTELGRRQRHFRAAAEGVAVGKISGAVGNFANLDPRIEAAVCKRLGLQAAEVSTQVLQRDRHAEYITSLALLASSLEKFATEIRNLQRTEIGEMMEGFTKGQKGSSAMPHKKNPITAERITGIARLLRGYALAAMENVPLWGERDIAHSSVERVIIPDATTIIDYGLQKFIGLMQGLVINEKRMLENIFYRGGLVFSQRLLLKLAGPVGSRDRAYRLVQRNAMAAAEGKGAFRELVKHDMDIKTHMNDAEIDGCFELSYYTKNVDKVFKRVFG